MLTAPLALTEPKHAWRATPPVLTVCCGGVNWRSNAAILVVTVVAVVLATLCACRGQLFVVVQLLPVCVTSMLLPQTECATVNDFVQCHHLVDGGCEWERLNNLDTPWQGAPHRRTAGYSGTGKSTIAWAWAWAWAWTCFKARHTNVVWVGSS